MFEALQNLFVVELSVPSESEADRIIAEQRQLWSHILQLIGARIHSRDPQTSAAAIHLGSHIPGVIDLYRRPHDVERGFVISGRLPLLRRSGTVLDGFTESHPYEMLGAILAEGGDGLLDILRDTGFPNDRASSLFGPRAQAAAARYLLEKRDTSLTHQITSAVEHALKKNTDVVQQNIRASKAALNELRADGQTHILSLTELGTGMRNELQRIEGAETTREEAEKARFEKATKDWASFISQARSDIEAAKALAFEAATFRSAREIWLWKKRKHSATFGIGLFVLTIIISGAITALIMNWQAVITAVPRNGQNEPIASFLVFIVVPLIAAAWVLRIFARYVTNSLTLGEDAEQRRAMLETYFSLVGNKDAKMEPSDRILILNAIFRPLPGHQTEDVAPPTLLDLTKEALTAKKGG